jgi:hypothetical protein
VPIRPENKARYPADWKAVRERVRTRAGDRCEWCGVPNLAWVARELLSGTWLAAATRDDALRARVAVAVACYYRRESCDLSRVVRVVCTTAHLHDPDPANVADDNLAFLCQRCHNRHDAPMRARNAADTRRRKRDAKQPGIPANPGG